MFVNTFYLDDIIFARINRSQISSLVIDISNDEKHIGAFDKDVDSILFSKIFTMFINLQYLRFGPSSICFQQSPFGIPFSNVISSNLLELHLSVGDFIDCFYLLDGSFNKLHTCHVKICSFGFRDIKIHNKVEYIYFIQIISLFCLYRINYQIYDVFRLIVIAL